MELRNGIIINGVVYAVVNKALTRNYNGWCNECDLRKNCQVNLPCFFFASDKVGFDTFFKKVEGEVIIKELKNG